MALLFSPPQNPSAVPKKVKPKVLSAPFGDSYDQRALDGINPIVPSWSLSWNNLTDAEATVIETFLEARAGVESFLWVPPRKTVAVKVVCPEWDVNPHDGAFTDVSANFIRDFSHG
jgi:phage-related protein